MRKQLDKLLALSTETEVVEFKKAEFTYSKDKLGRYFSALSNEANLKDQASAWMVLGVLDDKTINGTSITDATINDYKKEMGDHTSPRATFTDVHRITTGSGDVLMFEIPRGPIGHVVTWKGHAYGRDGESLVALHEQERGQIKQQIIPDWSGEIIPSASIADLDTDAILKARIEFKKKNPGLTAQVDIWDDISFLNKSKIAINGQITNAGILLLGKAESEHFINPATSKISWILQDANGVTKDYAHFTCPLLISVEDVFAKVRNLKYRYISDGSLFPQEVDQYDPYLIREALHNCIAHQDYTRGGKINLIEKEEGELIFSNLGEFIPKSVEHVVMSDTPEEKYRNSLLANAMVAYGMIDTVGSGIKRMFTIQRSKFFPLPEYDLSDQKVQVSILGRVLDLNYARKLALLPELTLPEIILLDKVSKGQAITKMDADLLRAKGLIEGRRPNYLISSELAKVTGEKAAYIKNRGLKDDHYKQMILEYLDKYGEASKQDIIKLLKDILPGVLNDGQNKNKISNIVYAMSKKDKTIHNEGTSRMPKWVRINN